MRHCLVIDDSRVIRQVAGSILSEFDFETGEAEDGMEALTACRRQMPELILLDWNIPNSNVMEFLRSLRRETGGDQPVVVYCTTENDVARINEAMLAGANDYMLKPYDRASLEEKLGQVGLI
jgi:two-component system chemotaxis response regulator CheY